jgi:hypothetical protein
MGRYRKGVEIAEAPAGTVDERWWQYLRDLGSYPLDRLPAGGAAALRAEWHRLDAIDQPIPQRVEALVKFCQALGVPAWAVRARTLVGQATARRRSTNQTETRN